MSLVTTQRAAVIMCNIGFLSDFNHIWSSSSDFHKSPRRDIPLKSVQWQPRWYNADRGEQDGTDGLTDSLTTGVQNFSKNVGATSKF